jgi:hypothetical protein
MSNIDPTNAVLCSYLGLTARDLAEIGSFSERFARDLLAGRRPFPKRVQNTLSVLSEDLANIEQVMFEQVASDDPTIYIFRTLEQLRSAPIGKIWPLAFLGPYRVAAFQVMNRCKNEGQTIHLRFAETPSTSHG